MNRILKDNNENNYGIVGDVTDMTYEDGSFMQVGDVVETVGSNGFNFGMTFVFKENSDHIGIWGWGNKKFIDGNNCNVKAKLIKKCYDIKVGEKYTEIKVTEESPYHTITIDGKDIKISEESFKELKRQLVEE